MRKEEETTASTRTGPKMSLFGETTIDQAYTFASHHGRPHGDTCGHHQTLLAVAMERLQTVRTRKATRAHYLLLCTRILFILSTANNAT
jgi:hypothetical protein